MMVNQTRALAPGIDARGSRVSSLRSGLTRRPPHLLRELIHGSDHTTPRRPGQHLETRQRLGILPTWTFWNRRDVWKTARWYVHPLAFLAVQVGFWIPNGLDLALLPRLLASQVIGIGTVALALGALERYIRRQITRRRLAARATL